MYSVKLGYLVCAITVHLLLFLFEFHGNKEYVRALAWVRAYVPVRVIWAPSESTNLKISVGRARPE